MSSDAVFYAITTDTAYEAVLTNDEFEGLRNVVPIDVVEFQEYVDAAKRVKATMRSCDWLSVDLQSESWRAAQHEYAQVWAKKKGGSLDDLGDLWLQQVDATTYPITGWEWGPINARYAIFAQRYLLAMPGHLFLVSEEDTLQKPTDKMKEKEDEFARKRRQMFKGLGVVPSGQKGDPFRFHSILHLDANGEKSQVMSTAKERFGKRRHWGKVMQNGIIRDEPMEDFFMDYLVNTAGWTL